ncbi:type VI secretion system baseplate subunit TssG [Corallincola platygyrae]|uniref:Type VI secretion system baseplate subunit TssG n=1 Tax=Corallincola platygyrae TaxID=1193278 RepID=A0ABW4XLK3_9GAMM
MSKELSELHLEQLSFFEVVKYLQRGKTCGLIGTDALPTDESIKLKASQSLSLPTQSVNRLANFKGEAESRTTLETTMPSLTGANGVLPKHYTELVLHRLKSKDTAMADFYDLFNHRLASLDYRAWEKFQYPIQIENEANGRNAIASSLLSSISGAKKGAEKYYAGHFSRRIVSAKSLQHMLEDVTHCRVAIKQNVGCWKQVARSDQTHLTSRTEPEGQYCQLGRSAILGKRTWDIESNIEIRIKASNEEQASRYMPGTNASKNLIKFAQRYLPSAIEAKFIVETQYKNYQRLSLGVRKHGLGGGARLSAQKKKLEQWTSVKLG